MAKSILRRVAGVPSQAYAAATGYLTDTLDWFRLWEDNSVHDDNELDLHFDTKESRHFPQP